MAGRGWVQCAVFAARSDAASVRFGVRICAEAVHETLLSEPVFATDYAYVIVHVSLCRCV